MVYTELFLRALGLAGFGAFPLILTIFSALSLVFAVFAALTFVLAVLRAISLVFAVLGTLRFVLAILHALGAVGFAAGHIGRNDGISKTKGQHDSQRNDKCKMLFLQGNLLC